MALTGAMWELSSVIALCTAPRIALESALPLHQQAVPERQKLNELGQLYGAMSLIYQTKATHKNGPLGAVDWGGGILAPVERP
ncbi:hypothetical protein BOO94_14420 [Pseudomonas sp. FSL W5-0299]|jgi:hypothetical protein|nr:hypothetical protein BOO94_14420 [Pseudomonas sp. FSL W5-0299]